MVAPMRAGSIGEPCCSNPPGALEALAQRKEHEMKESRGPHRRTLQLDVRRSLKPTESTLPSAIGALAS